MLVFSVRAIFHFSVLSVLPATFSLFSALFFPVFPPKGAGYRNTLSPFVSISETF